MSSWMCFLSLLLITFQSDTSSLCSWARKAHQHRRCEMMDRSGCKCLLIDPRWDRAVWVFKCNAAAPLTTRISQAKMIYCYVWFHLLNSWSVVIKKWKAFQRILEADIFLRCHNAQKGRWFALTFIDGRLGWEKVTPGW